MIVGWIIFGVCLALIIAALIFTDPGDGIDPNQEGH